MNQIGFFLISFQVLQLSVIAESGIFKCFVRAYGSGTKTNQAGKVMRIF